VCDAFSALRVALGLTNGNTWGLCPNAFPPATGGKSGAMDTISGLFAGACRNNRIICPDRLSISGPGKIAAESLA
jgi:hypothetical protein